LSLDAPGNVKRFAGANFTAGGREPFLRVGLGKPTTRFWWKPSAAAMLAASLLQGCARVASAFPSG